MSVHKSEEMSRKCPNIFPTHVQQCPKSVRTHVPNMSEHIRRNVRKCVPNMSDKNQKMCTQKMCLLCTRKIYHMCTQKIYLQSTQKMCLLCTQKIYLLWPMARALGPWARAQACAFLVQNQLWENMFLKPIKLYRKQIAHHV